MSEHIKSSALVKNPPCSVGFVQSRYERSDPGEFVLHGFRRRINEVVFVALLPFWLQECQSLAILSLIIRPSLFGPLLFSCHCQSVVVLILLSTNSQFARYLKKSGPGQSATRGRRLLRRKWQRKKYASITATGRRHSTGRALSSKSSVRPAARSSATRRLT
jgi:hypothetical protein